ncbi:hypothetical protein CHS0354_017190 [Potamilus streckersoni]|uniref:Uncharacterized protein n=1 Tax=Potamilus streckersoni TaxID=2493646 RepID=A0AAE0T2R4_9BIVA|nr:hypothetical protein CHS0354_017190 [Potamilus streckersoni]
MINEIFHHLIEFKERRFLEQVTRGRASHCERQKNPPFPVRRDLINGCPFSTHTYGQFRNLIDEDGVSFLWLKIVFVAREPLSLVILYAFDGVLIAHHFNPWIIYVNTVKTAYFTATRLIA